MNSVNPSSGLASNYLAMWFRQVSWFPSSWSSTSQSWSCAWWMAAKVHAGRWSRRWPAIHPKLRKELPILDTKTWATILLAYPRTQTTTCMVTKQNWRFWFAVLYDYKMTSQKTTNNFWILNLLGQTSSNGPYTSKIKPSTVRHFDFKCLILIYDIYQFSPALRFWISNLGIFLGLKRWKRCNLRTDWTDSISSPIVNGRIGSSTSSQILFSKHQTRHRRQHRIQSPSLQIGTWDNTKYHALATEFKDFREENGSNPIFVLVNILFQVCWVMTLTTILRNFHVLSHATSFFMIRAVMEPIKPLGIRVNFTSPNAKHVMCLCRWCPLSCRAKFGLQFCSAKFVFERKITLKNQPFWNILLRCQSWMRAKQSPQCVSSGTIEWCCDSWRLEMRRLRWASKRGLYEKMSQGNI